MTSRVGFLPAIACTVLLCSCASRKDASPAPSAAGLRKTATPTKGLKHFFPPGVDWGNASPDQISEVVYAAVRSDPDGAVEIVTAASEEAQKTGRFPINEGSDAKMLVDPEPKRTLFDVLFPKNRSTQ